jgi:hypothetical protein
MKVPSILTKLTALLIGFGILAVFWLLLGSIYFDSNTATEVSDDDYVIGYFQGPGRLGNTSATNPKVEKPERVNASAPGIGW